MLVLRCIKFIQDYLQFLREFRVSIGIIKLGNERHGLEDLYEKIFSKSAIDKKKRKIPNYNVVDFKAM